MTIARPGLVATVPGWPGRTRFSTSGTEVAHGVLDRLGDSHPVRVPTGGLFGGHKPGGRILPPGPGHGWGFPNGNPDGYG